MNKNSDCRKCRRAGQKLFLKGERCLSPKCAFTLRSYIPGQHGPKMNVRLTEYGKQLREKQKAQKIYGISARQLKNYFETANKKTGATNEILLQRLETRLDNILYRISFADSRRQARNLINDGHILVNDKKTTVPGILLKIGDKISLKGKSKAILNSIKEKSYKTKAPNWLKFDKKNLVGQLDSIPKRDEINTEIDESLIIEYFSR